MFWCIAPVFLDNFRNFLPDKPFNFIFHFFTGFTKMNVHKIGSIADFLNLWILRS